MLNRGISGFPKPNRLSHQTQGNRNFVLPHVDKNLVLIHPDQLARQIGAPPRKFFRELELNFLANRPFEVRPQPKPPIETRGGHFQIVSALNPVIEKRGERAANRRAILDGNAARGGLGFHSLGLHPFDEQPEQRPSGETKIHIDGTKTQRG